MNILAEIVPPVGIQGWAGAAGATIGAAIASWVATRREFRKIRRDLNNAYRQIRRLRKHLGMPASLDDDPDDEDEG